MRNRSVGAVLKNVQTLFDVGTAAGLSDGQLLESYLLRGDDASEAAFSALVERHGPMVLRVCRGVLQDIHSAEDAFQATFLVLAQGGHDTEARIDRELAVRRGASRGGESAGPAPPARGSRDPCGHDGGTGKCED